MGITVLSLFDGMSCGQIALRDLGIEVEAYYASEIDRFCIAQTRLNFPDTIELGDVRSVEVGKLPKIDLVLAGSPCQGFSFAGKQLNFDDPRSALFFEFHRILTEIRAINPDVKFLLENVRMKKSCEEIISEYLGVRPETINSALVSAQNRVRLYWSNIRTRVENLFETVTDIPQPADRGLYVRDIMEEEVDERYFLSDTTLSNLNTHKERNRKQGRGFGMEVKQPDEKSLAVRVGGKGMYDLIEEPAIIQRPRGYNQGGIHADKAPTLTANAWEQDNLLKASDGEGVTRIRRLTPTECSRLQTIPEWYRWECSATQQHKMLGNGWTVEVIKHILSFLTI